MRGSLRFNPVRYPLTAILAVLLLCAGVLFAPSAQAASVWAWGDGVITMVETGAKNTANRTQWVSSIYVETGTAASNSYGCGKFEAWTQGFYAATERCGNAYWTINKWVGTGNYVCGAFDDFGGWPRRVACIAIRV